MPLFQALSSMFFFFFFFVVNKNNITFLQGWKSFLAPLPQRLGIWQNDRLLLRVAT
jgi:hypothetical protein